MARVWAFVTMGLLATTLAPLGAAFEGPLDAADEAADDACHGKHACPLDSGGRTYYWNGFTVYADASHARDGGRVLYAGGPLGTYATVERGAGNVDGVAVKNGHAKATVTEPSDDASDPNGAVAASVLSNAWLVVALDPESGSHRIVVGWSLWPTGGNVGVDDGDPWLVACAAVVCPSANP